MLLVLGPQALQNGDGIRLGGLLHVHGRKAAFQGAVLLDIFAVFLDGRRADHLQIAAGEHGFQDIRRVHGIVRRAARPHDVMDFVDKENDVPVLHHGVREIFQPLLEIAAVSRPREHPRDIHRKHRLVEQLLGHVPVHDQLGEPLRDRAFAHARFADEHGIVLGPAGEHLNDLLYLLFPADDGVNLSLSRPFGHIYAVLQQLFPHVLALFHFRLFLFGNAVIFHLRAFPFGGVLLAFLPAVRTEKSAAVIRNLPVAVVEIVIAEFLAVLLGEEHVVRLFPHRVDIGAQPAQNLHRVTGIAFQHRFEHVRRPREGARLHRKIDGPVQHLLGPLGKARLGIFFVYAAEKDLRIFLLRDSLPRQNPVSGAFGQAQKTVYDVLAAHIYGFVLDRHIVGDFERLFQIFRKFRQIIHLALPAADAAQSRGSPCGRYLIICRRPRRPCPPSFLPRGGSAGAGPCARSPRGECPAPARPANRDNFRGGRKRGACFR